MELVAAYKLLKLSDGATLKDVTRAYRREVKASHPDRHHMATEIERANAEEHFKQINEAYHLILDEGHFGTASKSSSEKHPLSEDEIRAERAKAYGAFVMNEKKRYNERVYAAKGRDQWFILLLLGIVAAFGFYTIVTMWGWKLALLDLGMVVLFISIVVWLHRYFGE